MNNMTINNYNDMNYGRKLLQSFETRLSVEQVYKKKADDEYRNSFTKDDV